MSVDISKVYVDFLPTISINQNVFTLEKLSSIIIRIVLLRFRKQAKQDG